MFGGPNIIYIGFSSNLSQKVSKKLQYGEFAFSKQRCFVTMFKWSFKGLDDVPPSSLIDSTVSPNVKTMEG
jgi:hypothetical protein